MTADLIGYRCWSVHVGRHRSREFVRDASDRALGYFQTVWRGQPGLRLGSISNDMLWEGPIVHADYMPKEMNSFGLYALKNIEDAKEYSPNAAAYGEVALFGKIIEHENGYRAEHALVKRIWLRPACLPLTPENQLEQIAAVAKILETRYQCDVIVDSSPRGAGPLAFLLAKIQQGNITTADLERLAKL